MKIRIWFRFPNALSIQDLVSLAMLADADLVFSLDI
jgi:hypothetical protein